MNLKLLAYTLSIITSVISLLTMTQISRVYGLNSMGEYILFLTFISLSGFILEFGISVSVFRLTEKNNIHEYTYTILLFRIFIVSVMILIAYLLESSGHIDDFENFRAALYIALLGAAIGTSWINIANDTFPIAMLIDNFTKFTSFSLMIYCSTHNIGIDFIVNIFSISILINAFINFYINRRYFILCYWEYIGFNRLKLVFKKSYSIFFSQLSTSANDHFLPIFIGTYIGSQALGVFSIPNRLLKPATHFLQLCINMYATKIYGNNKSFSITILFLSLTLLVSIFVSILLLVFTEQICNLFNIDKDIISSDLSILLACYFSLNFCIFSVIKFLMIPLKLERFISILTPIKFSVIIILFLTSSSLDLDFILQNIIALDSVIFMIYVIISACQLINKRGIHKYS